MRRGRVLGLVAALALAGWGGVARAVEVGARIDKVRVEVGEPFVVTIVATGPVGRTLDLAPNLPLGEAFEEIARHEDPPRRLGDEVQESWTVTLVALEPGKLTVPALPVLAGGEDGTTTVETATIGVEVVSVVGDGPVELRPIAAPVTIWRRDLTPLWIGLGALAGLILLVAVVRALRGRVRRAAAEAAAPPPAPPEVVALGRLRAVEDEVRQAPDPRPAHFEMSEIVREYLGRRFAFDALEKTTDELAAALAGAAGPHGGLDEALRGELLAWLGARDLVKFARIPVGRDESLDAVKAAVGFVERTRPREVPADAGATAKGGPGGA